MSNQKLKYEKFCSKCNAVTSQRLEGGSLYETRYKCIKCKTINIESE
jgi:hypothetical protein